MKSYDAGERGVPEPNEVTVVEFCARLRPRLVGMLALYCGDTAVAEELAQETLARVWLNWSKVSRMSAPGGWAYRVAVNLANSSFRRRAAERRAHEKLLALGQVPGQVAHVDPDRADAELVRDAVAALPPRQRAVVVLRYFSDLSVQEVAEVMGCAEGTVKSLMHRATATLRERPGLRDLAEVPDGA